MSGYNADYGSILRKLGLNSDENDGSGIGDIIRVLDENGLSCSAVKINASDFFAKQDMVFIVYDPPAESKLLGHFYTVRWVAPGKIQVIDPPNTIRILEESELDGGKYIVIVPTGKLTLTERVSIPAAIGLLFLSAGIALIVAARWKKRHTL